MNCETCKMGFNNYITNFDNVVNLQQYTFIGIPMLVQLNYTSSPIHLHWYTYASTT